MNPLHVLFRVVLITLLFTNFPLFSYADEEDLADPGQITFRSQISIMDFEEIDPYTGTLSLTHKDVSLPGNGGLDLNIYRTYRTDRSTNYTVLGSRWDTHFGRIKRNGHNHVSIELQDGTVNSAVKENVNSGFETYYNYFTKDFWKVTMPATTQDGPILQLTDGTKIVFDKQSHEDWYYAVEIRRNNNTIFIHYVGTTRRIDYVTDSTGRRIDFNYQLIGGGVYLLKTIQDPWDKDLVSYTYSGTGGESVFESAAYPDNGDKWSYHYNNFTMEGGTILKKWIDRITTPYGGTVTYDYSSFKRANVGLGYKFQLSVSRKSVSGRGLTSGTWIYDYGEQDEIHRDYTTISDSCGRETTYNFYGYSGGYDAGGQSECYKYGLTRHKFTTNSSGQIEEAVEYTWDKLDNALSPVDYIVPNGCDDFATYVPVLSQQTIYHGGTVDGLYQVSPDPDNWGVHIPDDIYTTRYRVFDAYGNPGKATEYDEVPPFETSPALKTTTTVYRTWTDLNIVKGIPSSVRTQGNGTFPGDFRTKYDYDANGNLTEENRFVDVSWNNGIKTIYTYFPSGSSKGNLQSVIDANGHTTTYEWDKGAVKKTTKGTEYSINRIINWDGTIDKETNGRGYTTSYQYTPGMRLERIIPPLTIPQSNPTIFNYNFGADTYTKKTRGNFFTKTSYNGLGNISGTEDSIGKTSTITYKACGLKNSTSSNIGDTVNFDNFGRITKITHLDGEDINYIHHDDKHIEIIDEENKHSHQYYATFGMPGDKFLTSVRDALNQTGTYSYDILGSLLSASFGLNNRTFNYNPKHFLDRETHPESGTTSYTFDNVGNIKTKADGLTTKVYEYDTINRLKSITAGNKALDYQYDDADNLTWLTSPDGWVHYEYDENNRMEHVTTNTIGMKDSISYEYDGNDNIRHIIYPSGKVATYAYNNWNQVTGITDFGSSVSLITYYISGPFRGLLKSYLFGNNKSMLLSYNSRRAMTRTQSSGALDLSFVYNDKRGNMTALTNNLNPSKDKSFFYDDLDRLDTFDGAWGNDGDFNYNVDGDRNLKTQGTTITYGYVSNRLDSAGGINYSYNNSGDMETAGNFSFGYTPFHRIEWADNAGIKTYFGYDANDQRIYKRTGEKWEIFLRGTDGNVLADIDRSEVSQNEYVYLNDQMVAKVKEPYNDSDNDGLSDQQEKHIYNTDPHAWSSDEDSLSDGEEIRIGTDPNNKDSDNDGLWDDVDPFPLLHKDLHPLPFIYLLLLDSE